ncbi:hypothetical protein KAI52_02775, partial [Candidatus Parcubacteria bacterium]|nr:hypothetical protein [Candidatus Parcubacteria bacterium]
CATVVPVEPFNVHWVILFAEILPLSKVKSRTPIEGTIFNPLSWEVVLRIKLFAIGISVIVKTAPLTVNEAHSEFVRTDKSPSLIPERLMIVSAVNWTWVPELALIKKADAKTIITQRRIAGMLKRKFFCFLNIMVDLIFL